MAGAAALLGSCRSVPIPPAGTIGAQPFERQVPRWTDAQWHDGAARVWQAALDDARRRGGLDSDAAATGRARAIAQRLGAVTGALRAAAPPGPWPMHVARADTPDAWCLAGFGCMATTALVAMADNDDELAAALAHAVAHALLDHGREAADELRAERAAAGPPPDDPTEVITLAITRLPWRRAQELEADRAGVELAARAGYDPRAAAAFWRRALAAPSAPGAAGWAVRHPAPGNRMAELSLYAQRALPLYEGARGIIRSP